jgi:nucleotide-binding universal stress UspA family protein
MFNRVLVGIDAETHGRDAVALALALLRAGAELTIAHVRPGTGVWTQPVRDRNDCAREADRLLASVPDEAALPMGRWPAPASGVAAGLSMIADAMECDLLVVGATTRSRLIRKLFSDPTAETLRSAACVTAVAPHGYADQVHEFGLVGVAYDGSTASDAALSLGRRLAAETGASVSVLDVVARAGSVGPMALRFQRAAVELEAASHRVYPETVTANIAFGAPVQELSALSRKVDILVAGAPCSLALTGRWHPSTAVELSAVASCPLLVLSEQGRERAQINQPAQWPRPMPTA